ncbi:MAG: hypothetical protein ACKVS7_14565 [Gemmatimonadaceae bacterium]
MRARSALSVVVVAFALSSVASAQSPDSLRATIRPRVDTLVITQTGAAVGRRITTWTRLGLDQLIVNAEHNTVDGSRILDSTFSDPRTLRPTRSVRLSRDSVIAVLFGQDTVFVTTIIAGRSSTAWAVAPEAELFTPSSIDALAATMPLRTAATRRLLVFYAPPSTRSIQGVQLRVEGPEDVRGRAAWRVAATTPGGGSTYWIDGRTRAILRSDVRDGETLVALRP